MQTLLAKRGITDVIQAQVFLNPDYTRDFHDPFLMRDMEKACVRLFEAVEAGEKIVIYADYDCDGIPGAVILKDLFSAIGGSASGGKKIDYEVYIPQRNSEGYGLNKEAIVQFAKNGVKLIITIDLGVTAVEEVAQAQVLGIDTIITDHHLPGKVLPRAYAILNPKVDNYPEKMLCGAGVVFKLAQGFIKKYGEYFKLKPGAEKWMLDMAGLATLGDRVPLLGENRAIAHFGMKVLRKSPRPGLQKLFAKMNLDGRYLTEDDVGYMIIPKLNAASRMDNPMRAYELLATENEVQAGILADHLSKINDERKNVVTSIMREVNKNLSARGGSAFGGEKSDNLPEVIVIGKPRWRVGVLGLVAGKICDQYERPVFVWGKDERDTIRGSCRSPGSVSVVEMMGEASEFFSDFGGHELAGGFTVHAEKIHFLEEKLNKIFPKIKRKKEKEEAIFDIKSQLDAVNRKNWDDLQTLSPFGLENPKPSFLFPGVRIEKVKKFGKNGGEHLEIIFRDGDNQVKAVSFFSDHDSFQKSIVPDHKVDLLATFDLSRFRGREELRLRVIDVR